MANKSEIAAAKSKVSAHLRKLAACDEARREIEAAMASDVKALIELTGQSGPFRFGDNGDETIVVFRKKRDREDYSIHPHEAREVL